MNSFMELFNKIDINFVERLLVSVIIFAVFYITSSIISRLIIKFVFVIKKCKEKTTKSPFYVPLKSFSVILGVYFAILNLNVNEYVLDLTNKSFRAAIIWLVAMCIANLVTPTSKMFSRLNKNVRFTRKDRATSLLTRIIQIIVYLIAAVIIISEFGYDINGIIAGLGLGGLTVALAGQDVAKNLIGGLVIIFDKPFIAGDWIETPTIEGIVEDITFRSTRIRTFKDSVITIPNSVISNEEITNWSLMNKRRITLDLTVTFDTSLKSISNVISKIEEMLKEHPNVHNDVIHVRFNEIRDDGQNIHVYFYIDRTDYKSYLAIKENVNYKIMQILNNEKVSLAYKTQTIHIEK